VLDVDVQHVVELVMREDHQVVETLGSHGLHPAFGNWDGGRSTNTTAHAEVRALSLLSLRASATSRRRPMPRWLARRSEPG
jgi:hypothetical protein